MAIVLAIFVACVGLIWSGLHVGSHWFSTQQNKAASSTASALEEMFIFTDTNRILAINIVVLIMLPVLAWFATGKIVFVGLCVILAFVAPRHVLRYIAAKRLLKFQTQLPDALLMISGALRAGASLSIALESVANEGKPPISQEFELLLREMRLGVDFGIALQNLERRVPLQDLVVVTAGMALAREVGANLAETLDSISKTIRATLQMEGKIRSLTAQGKMQGIVMACLPLCLIFILDMMEPEAMAPMFNTWYGWATLLTIAVADLIGYHFIGKITHIDI